MKRLGEKCLADILKWKLDFFKSFPLTFYDEKFQTYEKLKDLYDEHPQKLTPYILWLSACCYVCPSGHPPPSQPHPEQFQGHFQTSLHLTPQHCAHLAVTGVHRSFLVFWEEELASGGTHRSSVCYCRKFDQHRCLCDPKGITGFTLPSTRACTVVLAHQPLLPSAPRGDHSAGRTHHGSGLTG